MEAAAAGEAEGVAMLAKGRRRILAGCDARHSGLCRAREEGYGHGC